MLSGNVVDAGHGDGFALLALVRQPRKGEHLAHVERAAIPFHSAPPTVNLARHRRSAPAIQLVPPRLYLAGDDLRPLLVLQVLYARTFGDPSGRLFRLLAGKYQGLSGEG